MAIPNVSLTVAAGGVGIIVPGVGAKPVNVAGWSSLGPCATPTPIGVGAVPVLQSTFGVGQAVELAASILANGAPNGIIFTRIFDGTIASPFTRTGSGPASTVTCTGSPMGLYGTATSTGSTGPIILITTGGVVGTSQFQLSLDGGVTWTPAAATAASIAITNTGLTIAFGAGTYVQGDTYVGAITSSTGASFTIVNNALTEMVAGSTSAQQLPVPGSSITGGGVVTMDATNNPQDAYNVVILIGTSGVLGVGQFSYSLDGGLTFSNNILIPSGGGPTSLGSTGIAVDWANSNSTATYAWNDTTDLNTVTFSAGTSFQGSLGNNLKVVIATGSSLANSISVSGNITTVTITIDTTVTTPALLATYVNSTAAATLAPYITISNHTGTTAFTVFLSATPLTGGAGGGGATSGFVAGESYVFSTIPPAITATDVLNVGEAITGNTLQWDWMHVVGRPTSSSGNQPSISAATGLFSTLSTIGSYWFTNQRYSFLVEDSPPCTAQNNISASLVSSFASLASDYVSVGGGDANIVSATTGAEVQRCASWAASIWGSTLPIGTDLAAPDLGNLPFIAQLLWNENTTPALDAGRFTTLRTIPTLTGFYLTNARIMSNPSTSNITYWQSRRVLNQACQIAYAFLVQYLSKPILVNASTGYILPSAATALQNALLRALNAGLAGQVSGVSAIVNTTTDVLTTETLEVTIGVVPLFYPKFIDATIGYVNPALSTQ